ncbi:hypothetical protein FA09DRAFT_331261 [Tilletiopsis washingtonensis]|uniref:Uncharacterized protein n=1 Tax=Tilletiopsis washingtonensis TaxID=58919 RepID=A0A316Z3J5_9BASI|nr:hypothetical protein FA09DRAFT_331261 [Tilletiopsis washingtonensis]PWN96367.1 hypothetical protein FA09DRAFT_331261 [Tilletiopsis washingtonensis]
MGWSEPTAWRLPDLAAKRARVRSPRACEPRPAQRQKAESCRTPDVSSIPYESGQMHLMRRRGEGSTPRFEGSSRAVAKGALKGPHSDSSRTTNRAAVARQRRRAGPHVRLPARASPARRPRPSLAGKGVLASDTLRIPPALDATLPTSERCC